MADDIHYDIEFATALHEANMSRLRHTMQTFLEGPDARNRNVARAVEILYDDAEIALGKSIARLADEVAQTYERPETRSVPESNAMKVDDLTALLDRVVSHMKAHFNVRGPTSRSGTFSTQ